MPPKSHPFFRTLGFLALLALHLPLRATIRLWNSTEAPITFHIESGAQVEVPGRTFKDFDPGPPVGDENGKRTCFLHARREKHGRLHRYRVEASFQDGHWFPEPAAEGEHWAGMTWDHGQPEFSLWRFEQVYTRAQPGGLEDQDFTLPLPVPDPFGEVEDDRLPLAGLNPMPGSFGALAGGNFRPPSPGFMDLDGGPDDRTPAPPVDGRGMKAMPRFTRSPADLSQDGQNSGYSPSPSPDASPLTEEDSAQPVLVARMINGYGATVGITPTSGVAETHEEWLESGDRLPLQVLDPASGDHESWFTVRESGAAGRTARLQFRTELGDSGLVPTLRLIDCSWARLRADRSASCPTFWFEKPPAPPGPMPVAGLAGDPQASPSHLPSPDAPRLPRPGRSARTPIARTTRPARGRPPLRAGTWPESPLASSSPSASGTSLLPVAKPISYELAILAHPKNSPFTIRVLPSGDQAGSWRIMEPSCQYPVDPNRSYQFQFPSRPGNESGDHQALIGLFRNGQLVGQASFQSLPGRPEAPSLQCLADHHLAAFQRFQTWHSGGSCAWLKELGVPIAGPPRAPGARAGRSSSTSMVRTPPPEPGPEASPSTAPAKPPKRSLSPDETGPEADQATAGKRQKVQPSSAQLPGQVDGLAEVRIPGPADILPEFKLPPPAMAGQAQAGPLHATLPGATLQPDWMTGALHNFLLGNMMPLGLLGWQPQPPPGAPLGQPPGVAGTPLDLARALALAWQLANQTPR